MNWHNFSVKNSHQEQWAFEQMSYLLFCAEFDNNIGLFRYKNQSGIETEPLEKMVSGMVFLLNFMMLVLVSGKKTLLKLSPKQKIEIQILRVSIFISIRNYRRAQELIGRSRIMRLR